MSLPVFLVESLAGATTGGAVDLTGPEGRHAVVVRRTRVGEQVVLTDGAGTRAVCTVTEVQRGALTASVDRVLQVPPERPRLVAVQAIAKGDRGELAVETLTEVGVDMVVPWGASRSVAVWRGDRAARSLEKWRSTAREAAKQARRSWFPEVSEPAATEEVAARLRRAALGLVLHEEATVPLSAVEVPVDGDVVMVVGPEGGITADELAAFDAAGAHVVRLGSSVLRTSTAGVAAAAAVLSRTPRWR